MHIPQKLYLSAILSLLLMVASACKGSTQAQESQPPEEPIIFAINPDLQYQQIHGFGASDAWSVQFVGKNWPLKKRLAMADLLFSTETDEQGNPEGIGLSMWRFNIGAGSARQGKASGIGDSWRRAESFLSADSTYDWSSQQGQQWFMRAARDRGVETFIGFVNSPPVLLTKNGKAFGDGDGDANIAADHYDEFADYLAKISLHFKQEGIPFDYLSPVNEPQWDWSQGNGQEGSPYKNSEIAGVVEALDQKITAYNLDTQIEIPEAAQINFLYEDELENRSGQADFFFGDESEVRSLPSLAHKVAAHSYFTTWPVETMIEQRRQLWQHLQQVDPELEYWMSEYCILADNEEIQGNGRDLGMDPALYVARLIHFDLSVANASSWQWWVAISPYDYKDGLVYIDHDKMDGEFYESKLLWALGNYSRYIRPGARRVDVSRNDDRSAAEQARGVMTSAYENEDGKLVIVAVNYSDTGRQIQLNVEGVNDMTFTSFETSEEADLEPQAPIQEEKTVTIPARSIVTFQQQD